MPPDWLRIAIGSRHVCYGAPLHDGLGYTALLRTIPDRRLAGAALMVGVEPCRCVADFFQVFDCVETPAEVADVHGFRATLPGDAIPQTPNL